MTAPEEELGHPGELRAWLLYTFDAADDPLCVDLGGRCTNENKKDHHHLTLSLTRLPPPNYSLLTPPHYNTTLPYTDLQPTTTPTFTHTFISPYT